MMVHPVALHDAECWPLIKSLESCLNVMEMSILRWSAGKSHLEHITNEEVQRYIRVEPITEKLWEWHLKCYSHMVCADPHTVTNVVYTLQVAGKHP